MEIVGERLRGTGVTVRGVGMGEVGVMGRADADEVYFLSGGVLEGGDWPRWRVSLTGSGRMYVVFLGGGESAGVVEAMRDGAYDVVYLGEGVDRWLSAGEGAARAQRAWLDLYAGSGGVCGGGLLTGESAVMEELRGELERVAPTSATVLMIGESGTGKERAVEALHRSSGRGGRLVALNCAAIPGDLLESELFGVEKGAFTGAMKARDGLVKSADGGTLFLDEVGEMELGLQPKLLRFLETRRVRRVGGDSEQAVDVRVVTATNRSLREEIDAGNFRLDLYYRISEIVLRLPPLRERAGDLPMLAREFMDEANERFGRHFLVMEPALLEKFCGYDWPGNVRELRAALHRMVVLHDGPALRAEWWDAPERREGGAGAGVPVEAGMGGVGWSAGAAVSAAGSAPVATGRPSRAQRYRMAESLLEESGGDRSWTAAQLGVHPATLFRWIRAGKVNPGVS